MRQKRTPADSPIADAPRPRFAITEMTLGPGSTWGMVCGTAGRTRTYGRRQVRLHLTTLALALVWTGALCGEAAGAVSDPAEGDWTPAKQIVIRISPCANASDRLCGLVVAWPNGKDGRPALDRRNPDPKLATRTIVGIPLIYGFRRVGVGRWAGGKIYNPQDGKTYDSNLATASNGSLDVKGCVLFLCESQVWKRQP